jgi:hypothetical protein
MKTRKQAGRFTVGEWVSFPYGARNLFAQVVEARGPLGVKGRHLYRIRYTREPGDQDSFEMPEDEMESACPPDKTAIAKYLEGGGLIDILRANLGGGAEQPRVWLTYRPRGELTHTFAADQGMVGGAAVPFFALHEGKVFAGKQEEVVRFLAQFGLDAPESREIIAAVGTAP